MQVAMARVHGYTNHQFRSSFTPTLIRGCEHKECAFAWAICYFHTLYIPSEAIITETTSAAEVNNDVWRLFSHPELIRFCVRNLFLLLIEQFMNYSTQDIALCVPLF